MMNNPLSAALHDCDAWRSLGAEVKRRDAKNAEVPFLTSSLRPSRLCGLLDTLQRSFLTDRAIRVSLCPIRVHPPPGQAQYSGYNDSAIAAFQAYLREKFGSITKLNRAWRTNYSAFSAIQPPPDPYLNRCEGRTRF